MAILLHPTALDRISSHACILQEYANHDAILYKVYVLGDKVYVYQRPSIPNLPKETEKLENHDCSYLEFDSQRPYPKLADFGFGSDEPDQKRQRTSDTSLSVLVTVDAVRPVVDALKRAFGLELFGFDIVIASGQDGKEREMLVVDVNYFPSYKEVPNFPSLLAQYLVARALEGRKPQTNMGSDAIS